MGALAQALARRGKRTRAVDFMGCIAFRRRRCDGLGRRGLRSRAWWSRIPEPTAGANGAGWTTRLSEKKRGDLERPLGSGIVPAAASFSAGGEIIA
jgi:hypothetical protein